MNPDFIPLKEITLCSFSETCLVQHCGSKKKKCCKKYKKKGKGPCKKCPKNIA